MTDKNRGVRSQDLPKASHLSSRIPRAAVVVTSALLLANCANQSATQPRGERSKEVGAFSHPKYGAASPRVVADGAEVPKGGGRYHVGNPYRVAGRTYVPSERPVGHSQTGLASWYGAAFHGRKTANGEVYDKASITAAHPTMPLPSYARVSNLSNGRSIIVRVNDRGPFHGGRVMDVSERVAWALDFKGQGTARVKVDFLGKAGMGGSDDTKLLASLRQDGQPATSPTIASSTTMVASAEPARAQQVSYRRDTPVVSFSSPPPPKAAQVQADDNDEAPQTAAATSNGRPATAPVLARNIPAPPERPFDLGTIPGASSPMRGTTALPAVRPRIASLSYAPESGTLSKFQQGNPLAAIPQPRFQAGPGKVVKTALVN